MIHNTYVHVQYLPIKNKYTVYVGLWNQNLPAVGDRIAKEPCTWPTSTVQTVKINQQQLVCLGKWELDHPPSMLIPIHFSSARSLGPPCRRNFPPAPKSPQHPPASTGQPPHPWRPPGAAAALRVLRRPQAKNAQGLAKAVVDGGEKLHFPSLGAQPEFTNGGCRDWQGLAGIGRVVVWEISHKWTI